MLKLKRRDKMNAGLMKKAQDIKTKITALELGGLDSQNKEDQYYALQNELVRIVGLATGKK